MNYRQDFNGLGISFEDDYPAGVRVRSLSANGPASRDGRLQNGDRILAVNDQNCQKASYREVTDILKTSRGTIKLLVLHSPRRRDSKGSRGSNASRDQEIVPGNEIEIEIIKGDVKRYHKVTLEANCRSATKDLLHFSE